MLKKKRKKIVKRKLYINRHVYQLFPFLRGAVRSMMKIRVLHKLQLSIFHFISVRLLNDLLSLDFELILMYFELCDFSSFGIEIVIHYKKI